MITESGYQLKKYKPMTIGYVTSLYARASDTFIRGEVIELRKKGHTVHTFSVRKPTEKEISDEILIEKRNTDYILDHKIYFLFFTFVQVILMKPKRIFSAIKLIIKINNSGIKGIIWHIAYLIEAAYLSKRVDILKIQHLHVHIPEGVATMTMLAAHLSNISFSMTVHGPGIFFNIDRWAIGEKVHRSAFTICITQFCRSQCMAWSSWQDWEKLKIVHCGLSEEVLGRRIEDIPDTNRIVSIGRICENKGHLLLIDAISILKNQNINCKLTLIGDGDLRAELERIVLQLGLTDQITFSGWLPNNLVIENIIKSRAVVMPSFAEGLPVVLMETYAVGRPAITTNIAGHPELIFPKENGWLVPAGSVIELSDAIKEVLNTPINQLTKMAQHGRDIVLKNHNIQIEVSKLELHFHNAIANNRVVEH